MAELTPEERRRIYEEEKVRMEAQASLRPKQSNGIFNCCGGCAVLVGVGIILILLLAMFNSSSSKYSPSTYSSSSVPSAQVDALQKEMEASDARDKAKIVLEDQTNERDGKYIYVRGSVKNGGKWKVKYW